MDTFGHYTILERLRDDASGEFLRARDTNLGRTVALRIVSPALTADEARRSALLAAAAAAAAVVHPHVAALYDFGEHDGRVFLAHEYVPGQPLQALLLGRPFEVELCLEFAVQLADALAEAHRHGIVHGSLSPVAIFITPTDQAKILSLGLREWTSGGAERSAIGRELATVGEPFNPEAGDVVPYLSPEQVLGERPDARSDVFTLGTVLYQMLTGQLPFAGATPGRSAAMILHGRFEPATTVKPGLPAGFDDIFKRALATSLDARYPDAAAMAADLRQLAERLNIRVSAEVKPAREAVKAERPRGPFARHLPAIAATLAAAAILIGSAWVWRADIGKLFRRRAAVENPVLVVVPFQMAPEEKSRRYYGVGFAEDLAARLGEVPGLTVAGRATIAAQPPLSLEAAAKATHATVALRGTTRPGPYSLHVDVELVDVATGRVLWSEKYAREPRQASAAEVEIARSIADELGLQMPTGNRWARAQVRQVDPGAYDIYLQARDAAARRDRTRAIALYRQAVDLDPKLVEARVGLSEALYQDQANAGGDDAFALRHAREEVEAALAVDAEIPRAHVAAALSAPGITTAATSLSRALALDPSNGDAWRCAGDLVLNLDPERAIAYYQYALTLEPSNDDSRRDIAAALEALGREAEARSAIGAGEAARPDRPWWTQLLARLEIGRQQFDKAADLMSSSAESSPSAWLFGRVAPLKMSGRDAEAGAEAKRLLARYPGYCEARAVSAGLEWDANNMIAARAAVDAILAAAGVPGAPAGMPICAATAAAAIGDGPQAASILVKLAADEPAVREWTRPSVFNAAFVFRARLYPWSKVQASGPVAQATEVLAATLQRLKDETGRRLPAPPAKASVPAR